MSHGLKYQAFVFALAVIQRLDVIYVKLRTQMNVFYCIIFSFLYTDELSINDLFLLEYSLSAL